MKILIVDDSKATLEIIHKALQQFRYRRLDIRKHDNPLQALELLKSWQPDIVLTDLYMPDMSGIELIEQALEILPEVKIGLLTIEDDRHLLRTAKQSGAHFVMSKPFGDEELHHALQRVIQQTEDVQILPNQSVPSYAEGIALPKLSQLEKLLKKSITSSISVSQIHCQKFDDDKLPCMMAIYVDAENQKPRAVAVLDIYAICVYASSNTKLSDAFLKEMMLKQQVNDEMIQACKSVLETSALAFLDNNSRFSLKLKSLNVFYERFNKLENIYRVMPEKRLDFSCQLYNLAQGRITMVGL